MTPEQGKEIQARVDTINVLSSVKLALKAVNDEEDSNGEAVALVISYDDSRMKHLPVSVSRYSGVTNGEFARTIDEINSFIAEKFKPYIDRQKSAINVIVKTD